MTKFALLSFMFLVCTFAKSDPHNKPYNEIETVFMEEPCVMQGGLCVKEVDCRYPTAVKGLCPQQQSQGVECCYGISQRETRCMRYGGSCVARNFCPTKLTVQQASDCGEDNVCCVFV